MTGRKWIPYIWEVALAVADQQARLATAAVAHHNNLLRVRRRLRDVRGGRHGARGAEALRRADGAIARARALPPARRVALLFVWLCPRRRRLLPVRCGALRHEGSLPVRWHADFAVAAAVIVLVDASTHHDVLVVVMSAGDGQSSINRTDVSPKREKSEEKRMVCFLWLL